MPPRATPPDARAGPAGDRAGGGPRGLCYRGAAPMLLLRDVQKRRSAPPQAPRGGAQHRQPPQRRGDAGAADRHVGAELRREAEGPVRARVPLRPRGATHRRRHRHQHGHRPARHLRRSAHLLRGQRARALLGIHRPALPAQGPLHRLQLRGANGDRRPGGGPSAPERPREARQAALLRALPVHGDAPDQLPGPGARRADASAHARRAQRALGVRGQEVHRPHLLRGGQASAGRTRSSSRSCSPPRTSS